MSINEFPDSTNDSPESFNGQNIEQDSSEPSEEQKREIARWISEGMGLSDVQKKIDSDFGLSMTYMDVRFLVDDLDLTLVDKEEEKPKEVVPESAEAALSEDPLGATGGVSVEVNPVTPPGAMASGTVTFSDGQNKQWTLDQFGRLGLSGGDEGYKPSDEDVMEFQKQLDAALRGKGF
jgi:hypothetical protein